MSLRDLYQALKPDKWRRGHKFSKDIDVVNEVLFDTYATPGDRKEMVLSWFQRHQPCLFGRVAASSSSLHLCILTETDFLTRSDRQVKEIIKRELLEWKRRSARPTEESGSPAHGFVLLAASRHLAYAAPDEHLYALACRLRDVWGCRMTKGSAGTTHWETLYLQNPEDGQYVQFTFTVDFFGAQGDGRWWHDHRSPGGILFTANSIGYMQKYRELYQELKDQQDWVLQTAMLTIHKAAQTEYGKATRLKKLGPGKRPFLEDIPCPFTKPEALKTHLTDKDWTRYAGYLHTDHSIRPEFFHEDPAPIADITEGEYLQDFTYLYHAGAPDHAKFVAGNNISEKDVFKALGPVSEWNKIVVGRRKTSRIETRDAAPPVGFGSLPTPSRTGKVVATPMATEADTDRLATSNERASRTKIEALLKEGRKWRLSIAEKKALDR
jgi:hypothetical protein